LLDFFESNTHFPLPQQNQKLSNMAPLIQDSDVLSSSCHSHDDTFDQKVTFAPLHDGPVTSTRRVTFDQMATVFDVMGLDEYTAEEKKASHYNLDDMRRMKETVRSDAKLLDSGLLVQSKANGAGISFRGLEHRTKEGAKRKRRFRLNAYEAVFSEIEFQKQEGMTDEDSIADIYFIHSELCAVDAQMVAKRDAIEAMNIYMKSAKARKFWKTYLRNDF
jgi:hypothetical protein